MPLFCFCCCRALGFCRLRVLGKPVRETGGGEVRAGPGARKRERERERESARNSWTRGKEMKKKEKKRKEKMRVAKRLCCVLKATSELLMHAMPNTSSFSRLVSYYRY
jgi:hypothetical protein